MLNLFLLISCYGINKNKDGGEKNKKSINVSNQSSGTKISNEDINNNNQISGNNKSNKGTNLTTNKKTPDSKTSGNREFQPRRFNEGRTPLHLASKSGNIGKINELLKENADIEAIDDNKYTPLHLAVLCNRKEAVGILLEQEKSINTIESKDNDGSTPLHIASKMNRIEIAAMLLEKGASIDAKDNEGKTPLDLATPFAKAKFEEYKQQQDKK